ncbi:MAG: tripartite tricarboxylate transporter substrate binding protein [Betaproteobacteria bacterium]|nr:tripartite tricarboxylate transporter substrate binding protein [Betaproteobacteria bacterium]
MFRSAATFALALTSVATSAQNYPAHPVKVVVPYAVGGSADVYGRVLAAKLSESMGHPFVIENRPGGGAVIGTDAVAKAPPDGYTLLVMSNTHTVNETLIPKKPYDLMRDLAPITGINSQDLMLVAAPGLKAGNLREVIALAKKEPGKLNYASSGPGTPYHMAGELFKYMAGVDIVHVPHKGSDQARTAVLGGQVELMFDAISTIVSQVRAGKLKALGTTGKTRSSVTPDIPTLAEAGVPGYEATIWLGLMAPAATPKPILERLSNEVRKVINAPDVKDNWARQGAVPMAMAPEEFGKFVREDIGKWGKLVKDTGMKVD